MRDAFSDSIESASDRSSNNFDDIGIPTATTITENKFGQVRTIRSISVKEWIFLATSGIGICASISFALYFVIQNANNSESGDFTLALLILLNACFMLYYLVDGVFTEKAYELLVLVISTALITIYLIANFVSTEGWKDKVKIARLIIATSIAPISVAFGTSVIVEYLSSSNFVFRKVGADSFLQKLCKRLFLTESVSKFDLQSTLSVVMLLVRAKTVLELAEILIIAIGVPFSLLWLLLLVVTLRLENKTLFVIVAVTSIIQPSYLVFTLVDNTRFINNITTIIPSSPDLSDYPIAAISLGTASIGIINRVILMILCGVVAMNFNKGLREKVVPPFLQAQNPRQRFQ